jgi:polar amino acid transport system substrate-binding protein
MKPFSIVALILLTICARAQASELLIQLNTTGQPPLNTASQNGFMDEITFEAFRRLNITLRIVQLPAERGLKRANRGIVDGEMSRVKGLDKHYKNLIRVPEKIMDWEFVAFSHLPSCLTQGWESLSDKSVAHLNGWKILENNIPATAEVIKTSNANILFNLLQKKRTDYAIYEVWGGFTYCERCR